MDKLQVKITGLGITRLKLILLLLLTIFALTVTSMAGVLGVSGGIQNQIEERPFVKQVTKQGLHEEATQQAIAQKALPHKAVQQKAMQNKETSKFTPQNSEHPINWTRWQNLSQVL